MEFSSSDRNRFAACLLNYSKITKDTIDWNTAAAKYDTAIKPASFRTGTQKAMKKAGNSIKGCTEADLHRFAVCYVHASDKLDIDWATASAEYNDKVKVASFKTVTQKAVKRYEGLGANSPASGTAGTPPLTTTPATTAAGGDGKTPKAKPGRKRNSAAVDAEGEEEVASKKKKGRPAKAAKTAKVAKGEESSDDAGVKTEVKTDIKTEAEEGTESDGGLAVCLR